MTPSLVETMRRYLTLRTHYIHTLPVLVLMPHSRCNCRCVMCDIWKANRNGTEISAEQLEPHLQAMRQLNVQWVTLSGGEALMHSNLWTLCRRLKELGMRITLLSTGLLLPRAAAEVVRWCDEVIVSLDGDQETHDAIRNVPRAFERLTQGIAALRQQDERYPVSGRCVLHRHNYSRLPQIVTAAQTIHLDHISFLAADVSSSAFNRPDGWDGERIAEIALSRSETEQFAHIVEEMIRVHRELFETGFIVESPDKIRRLAQYYAALNGDGAFPPVRCNAPWVSAVIEADGELRPCFFHESLGNIHQQSLPAILNSPEAIAFRRSLDMDDNPICRKCVCTLHLSPTRAAAP